MNMVLLSAVVRVGPLILAGVTPISTGAAPILIGAVPVEIGVSLPSGPDRRDLAEHRGRTVYQPFFPAQWDHGDRGALLMTNEVRLEGPRWRRRWGS